MQSDIELIKEAREIIANAKAAYRRGEISLNDCKTIIQCTVQDVGYQLEIITQPRHAAESEQA